MTADIIANYLKIPLLKLDLARIMGSFVGQSERAIANALRIVKACAPCTLLVDEAEKWIMELGYDEIIIDSRIEAMPFYEKLGYVCIDGTLVKSGNFDCTRMHKMIRRKDQCVI